MIQIRTLWAGLFVAITVNDRYEISVARGLTSEHARRRLINKIS